MHKKFFVLALLLAVCTVTFAGGNVSTSSVSGVVTDRDGNAIAGAEVVLLNSNKSVYTDFDGQFEFENVPQVEQKMKVKYVSYEETITSFQPDLQAQSKLEIRLRSK